MPARFLVDAVFAPGVALELPEPAAHHALRVLRLRDGDAIELFDGRGNAAAARLAAHGRRAEARIRAAEKAS